MPLANGVEQLGDHIHHAAGPRCLGRVVDRMARRSAGSDFTVLPPRCLVVRRSSSPGAVSLTLRHEGDLDEIVVHADAGDDGESDVPEVTRVGRFRRASVDGEQ